MHKLIARLLENEIYISANNNKLNIEFNNDSIPDDLLNEIKENKEELLAFLKRGEAKSNYEDIQPVESDGPYDLSSAQKRLWVLSQFDEGATAYGISGNHHLNENINIDHFKRAINDTIDRHEILRTVFKTDDSGTIKQWVLDRAQVGFKIDYIDFRSEDNSDEKVRSYITEDSNKPFDLENGPLLKASLLQIGDEQYIFYYNMHHIISDGWSMEVLSKDVFSFYQAYSSKGAAEVKNLPIQYKDYSAWQLRHLEGEAYQSHKSYWLNVLSGELPSTDFPSKNQRPRVKTYDGYELSTYLDADTTDKLRRYVQKNGGSRFIFLVAAWNVLMYKYTAQRDNIIGTAVAGRDHADLKDQIGFYVNTLALRNEINPDENFDVFYQNVKHNILTSYDHQSYPFDRLVEDLDLQRDSSRSPVFDISMTYHNISEMSDSMAIDETQLSTVKVLGDSKVKFDIELHFQEVGDYLSFKLIYNKEVYDVKMIEGLMTHFKQLLTSLLDCPTTEIGRVGYLTNKEKEKLIFDFNTTEVSYPNDKTIALLFEEQAAKTPNSIAVIFENDSLTYRELNELSNQLAHCLTTNYGIRPNDTVGIQLEMTHWTVIVILGILKSGGVYVPINPGHPASFKQQIAEETDIQLLITEANALLDIDYHSGSIFAIDVEFTPSDFSVDPLEIVTTAQDLAYVMYTSGSTGVPKGIMIEQRAVVRLVKESNYISVGQDDKILGLSNFSFDGSTFDIFMPLLNGARLVISTKDIFLNPDQFNDLIKQEQITCFFVTTALFNSLVESELDGLENLKYILFGGEQVSVKHVNQFQKNCPNVKLHHVYGPTENTTFSTWYPIENLDANARTIPIGSAISNSTVYVLDDALAPVPVGVIGEICVGGDGLARAYLNHVELTAEKFVTNPNKTDERIYKTGDFGKWTAEGQIEFIGRKDNQVKILGHRIELGEIEHRLLQHPDIDEAVVMVIGNETKDRELVAYITAKSKQTSTALRAYLKDYLPPFMIPGHYVQLAALPLNSNGKVDRKVLQNSGGLNTSIGIEYVPPKNDIEERLVRIWEEVLQQEKIGVKDDFFERGGNSLKAIKIANEFGQQFEVKPTISELFLHTTPELQAELIQSLKRVKYVQIDKIQEQSKYVLSPSQSRLWLLNAIEGVSNAYNLSGQERLSKELNIEVFKESLQALVSRHEILKTTFFEEGGVPYQKVHENVTIELEVFQKEDQSAVEDTFFNHTFDLSKLPLLKVALINRGEDYQLLYNMHHIISDGWSMDLFVRDLTTIYESKLTGIESNLPILDIQYRDYAAWQNQLVNSQNIVGERDYWLNKLSGNLPKLNLPIDYVKNINAKKSSSSYYRIFITRDVKLQIEQLVNTRKLSLFSFFVSTFKIVLSRITGQKDIIVGTPVANRNHVQVKELIGFFLNTLMLRDRIDSDLTAEKFLDKVNQTILEALDNQSYPFESLLDELSLPRDRTQFPISPVFMNMIDFDTSNLETVTDFSPIAGNLYNPSKFHIECYVKSHENAYSIDCVYNGALFKTETIKYWIDTYLSVIEQIASNPDMELGKLKLFETVQESNQKIIIQNDFEPFTPDQIDQTIVKRFETQVNKYPNELAIVQKNARITYKVLNEHSNGLGRIILEKMPKDGQRVALLLNHGVNAVKGMLATLKAGKSYVPLDPTNPALRLRFMLNDADCKLILVCNSTVQLAKEIIEHSDAVSLINVDEVFLSDQTNIEVKTLPNSEAYVLYTSGSTGEPKGVIQNHRNVLHHIRNYTNNLHLSNKDVLSLLPYYTFDASVMDIYGALFNGASLNVYDIKEDGLDRLADWINEEDITVLHMVPTIYRYLMERVQTSFKTPRLVVLGGEAVQLSDIESFKLWFKKQAVFVNGYGPTESTITMQHFLDHDTDLTRINIPIGKAVAETEVMLLNELDIEVGIYEEGEIVYKSDFLTLGYLNNSEQTDRVFTVDPRTGDGRVYRSGDLGMRNPKGEIEFIGRKDGQVKLNGHRIELTEIEHHVLNIPEIEESVVVLKKKEDLEFLVAYYRSKEILDHTEIKRNLGTKLPQYMVPSIFVYLEEFPLTDSGKISRKELPDVSSSEVPRVEYIAPLNEIEAQVAEIWEMVLDKQNVGRKDDFFDLGGYSMKALGLIAEYNKSFNVRLVLQDVFERTKVFEHAEMIEVKQWINTKSNEPGPEGSVVETFEF
jgi:amino acid adenylation domain-containing protein